MLRTAKLLILQGAERPQVSVGIDLSKAQNGSTIK